MTNPAPDPRPYDATPERRSLRAGVVTLSVRLSWTKDQGNDPEYRKFRVKLRVSARSGEQGSPQRACGPMAWSHPHNSCDKRHRLLLHDHQTKWALLQLLLLMPYPCAAHPLDDRPASISGAGLAYCA